MAGIYVWMKLILLCALLNLIRYYVIGFIEGLVVMGPLWAAMEESISYFNTDFQTIDWVTSYTYNFVMWLAVTFAFHKTYLSLQGHMVIRSLKVYLFFFVVFASVSAIYMNHYNHPKDFYLYNILDAALVFPLVALANGYLYPLLFRPKPDFLE